MTRPKAQPLLSITDQDWNTFDVLVADTLYALTFKDKFCCIRSSSLLNLHKYNTTASINFATVASVAKRMNKKFSTTEFSVGVLLTETNIVK